MTSSWAEFCEQTNPGVLSEARGARAFQNARRVQESISAAAEKRALVWMAERTPAWINSDHLTLLGFLAQILAGVGYALSRWNRYWLMAMIGSSGTARDRKSTRLNSSHRCISYAVFCLKKKTNRNSIMSSS